MDDLRLVEIASDPFVQTGLLALVGAVFTHLLLRRYPAWRLVFQTVFFLLLTVLLHLHDIVPYEIAPSNTPVVERFFVALAKIIWWANAAWVMTACVHVFLIFEGRPREGRLIRDLLVGIVYLGAILSIIAYVFSAPIGTLIATSGVLAIILGLALQSTLSDVFSGIALNLSKSYDLGDWIVLSDGIEGRVVEINWRATHLLNGSNDLVVIPNSSLAKAQITNLSNPNRSHGVALRIRVVPTMAPSGVSEILRTVLLSSNSIMASPAPNVEIKSLDAQAIEFELSFRVKDFATASKARHEVYDLIYRHAKAAGLALASSKEAVSVSVGQSNVATAVAPRATALRLIDTLPLFASLTEEEKEALATTMVRRTYRKGEVLVAQGNKLHSMFVIRTGVVTVSRKDGNDGEVELGRLSPGDYFGEGSCLTGSGEHGSVRALTFTVAYEIDQATLAKILRDRPSIADEISVTLSQRAKSMGAGIASDTDAVAGQSASWLVGRIRQLFELPNG
jgi:small-conductance mechanosensitive channel